MSETANLAVVAIVLIPLFVIWALALFNIVARRKDLSTAWKVAWSAVVILIPYVGVLIYATVRPPRVLQGLGSSDTTATGQAIDEIHHVVAEHEAGAIDDSRFAADKAAIFGMAEA